MEDRIRDHVYAAVDMGHVIYRMSLNTFVISTMETYQCYRLSELKESSNLHGAETIKESF